jgi:tetratricopeptide (TPR) repeat protein
MPMWQLARGMRNDASLRDSVRRLMSDALPTWAALVVATTLYGALRYAALGTLYVGAAPFALSGLPQHLLLSAKTLAWYLALLCWPFGQIGPVHPGSTPMAPGDVTLWINIAAVIAVGGGVVALLRRAPRAGLLLGAALIALVPVANLVPLTIGDNIVHDRYLLLPLAFASLSLALLPVMRFRRSVLAGVTVWIALSLTTIVITVPRWASNLSLWRWAFAMEPESAMAQQNYISALINSGQPQEALDLSREWMRSASDQQRGSYNMALALMRLGQCQEAKKYAAMSLQGRDDHSQKGRMDAAEVQNLLGYLSIGSGDWDAAEKSLTASMRLSPYLTLPHFNMAKVHYARGQIDAGDTELAFALRYDTAEMAEVHRALAAKFKADQLARGSAASGLVESNPEMKCGR